MSGYVSSLAPIPLYLAYAANEPSYAAQSAQANPETQVLANYFTQNAANITSPQALLGNYKALGVVLGAFNMGGQINETAVLQQLMTQDPRSSTSLAQQSGNPDYLRFANFLSNWSPSPFATPANVTTIANAYLQNQFEQVSGQQSPGMQQALYFTRSIGSITSINALLGDSSALPVVLNAVGLPPDTFGALSFAQQTQILTPLVNFSDFTNPAWVKSAAEQYLIYEQEANAAGGGASPGSLAGLFDPTTSAGDAGADLLSLLPGANTSSTGTTASVLSLFA